MAHLRSSYTEMAAIMSLHTVATLAWVHLESQGRPNAPSPPTGGGPLVDQSPRSVRGVMYLSRQW